MVHQLLCNTNRVDLDLPCIHNHGLILFFVLVEVLRPVNPLGLCRAWSVDLLTLLLGRLSPPCGSPGPSCSKLTTSFVNDSLKFTSSDMQICRNFLLKKM